MTDGADNLSWIRKEDLVRAHDEVVKTHGGSLGIRDEGALASALSRPRNRLHYGGESVDVFDLAAEYAFGIARNHPFADGNKRTSYVAMKCFIDECGYAVVCPNAEQFDTMVNLASGKTDAERLAAWLRRHSRPLAVS